MHWILDTDHSHLAVGAGQIGRLIREIGNTDRAALATAMLDVASPFMPIEHVTVFAYESERHPRLLSAAGNGGQAGNGDWDAFRMAATYIRDHFRADALLGLTRSVAPFMAGNKVLMHRQRAEGIADPAYRAACFDELGLVDRLSALVQVGKGQWVVTHLYRHRSQGPFCSAEVETLCALAPLLTSCAARHYSTDIDGESGYRGAISDGISDLGPNLTTREREVLLRILDGLTTERIATDLNIRPTTVITYRTRAYDKLGVSSRRELFAIVLRKQNQKDAPADETPASEAGAASPAWAPLQAGRTTPYPSMM
jgi:DNA-binding CsgD family transcriptional regulator